MRFNNFTLALILLSTSQDKCTFNLTYNHCHGNAKCFMFNFSLKPYHNPTEYYSQFERRNRTQEKLSNLVKPRLMKGEVESETKCDCTLSVAMYADAQHKASGGPRQAVRGGLLVRSTQEQEGHVYSVRYNRRHVPAGLAAPCWSPRPRQTHTFQVKTTVHRFGHQS